MEKRVFVAIFLMFVVVVVYDYYIVPKFQTPAPVTAPAAAIVPETAPAAGTAPATAGATTSPSAQKPTAPVVQALVTDTEAHDIVVETNAVRAVFSTAGGTLRSWKLKNYRDATGLPFEVVPQEIPAALPRPYTLATNDPDLSQRLASALYRPSTNSLSLGGSPGTLTFEYRDASGLNARKTFHFQPEGKPYLLNVTAAVDVSGASRPVTVEWGPALGLGYRPDGSRATETQGVLMKGEKVQRLSASALQSAPTQEGPFQFAGAEEQYFLSVVLPGTQPVHMEFRPTALPTKDDPKVQRKFISYSVGVPGEAVLSFFLGPKDFDELHKVDPKLTLAIDFGFFGVLVVPLLQALKWINTYMGNYGWSIVILTILINLLIFPLRHRSMVSMKKMQAAQPEIKAIQDRYAKYKFTDPEKGKMQTELRALYQQKGIHPMSGCVPQLMTLPVLFAFYAMLLAAIELRGAPFALWIHDLALRDPYYITPVLMGGTMFWQQRTMPSPSMDPVQQKIMMFMPVMVTAMFLWAPAGLVLYWLTSNIMGILQQAVTLKIIGVPKGGPPKARALVKTPVNNGARKS